MGKQDPQDVDSIGIGPLEREIVRRGGLHELFPHEPAQIGVDTLSGRTKPSTRDRKIAADSVTAYNTWRDHIRRAHDRGWIALDKADEFCCKVLGVHPYTVWGDEWFEEEVADDA